MTELSLFRTYEPHELGKDGYPHVWHTGLDLEHEYLAGHPDPVEVVVLAVGEGDDGVKHLVRGRAGNRCVRCGHRFVVGESGVMEGPHANAKGLAAEMGMNVEDVDRAIELFADGRDPIVGLDNEEALDKTPRTNWSPCDERCTHGGPVRTRSAGAEWIEVDGTNAVVDLVTSGMEVQASWRILTVHHLNGRKHDLRWWNLISVCQRCHLWLQRKVIMERVYPFEHDDYFKPYAAGWYAYAYLGENLTRGETEERMDELLALERMA